MNRYHESMEHCAPPPELEEQLREAVLSAEPEPQARTAVYRPRGFFRKALLAAVLAVVLTLSVGAAVLVDWDDIFSDRFGPEGAETPMAEKAFQPVNMTSVCDDVTLTIREALVDEKSIYLILDYQLPDSVDPETVEIAYNSRENTQKDDIKLPMVTYYATDDIAWEDLKAAEQDTWATLDWTDPLTRIFYGKSESTLNRIGRVNGSSGLGETGYEPEMAYFETCHEMKLIIDLINEGGFGKMSYSISNTAEYGDYRTRSRLITEDTRKEMRQILKEIQDGTFASEFLAEMNPNGGRKTHFLAMRRMAAEHPIEKVGAQLRSMMSWLKK